MRWGGTNWEIGIDIYTLLYVKQKTQGPTVHFSGSSAGKESACDAGDPGSRRSPGEGNSYPLQYSCPENSMDRGAWQVTVHGIAKSWTQLSDFRITSRHFKHIEYGTGNSTPYSVMTYMRTESKKSGYMYGGAGSVTKWCTTVVTP